MLILLLLVASSGSLIGLAAEMAHDATRLCHPVHPTEREPGTAVKLRLTALGDRT